MTTDLYLRDVTICSVDCLMPDLALRALEKSIGCCKFADSFLLTDRPINGSKLTKVRPIEKLDSIDMYSEFILKDLHQYINTPFVLLVQWDGYVLDPLAWDPIFMSYDFIGAKWHWHKDGKSVGNGGFSLRSKKLLEATARAQYPFVAGVPEDEQICRVYRSSLEVNHAIKFAVENVADHFSYERSTPNFPTFGFHGIFNMWRYLDDNEVRELSKRFPRSVFSSTGFYEFFLQYFILGRFKPLHLLYSELIKHINQEEIFKNVLNITKDENFTRQFIHLCNQIISRYQHQTI